MAGTAWPMLADGRKFKASEVEAKFDWLEGSIVPQTGGVVTDNVYDLGTPSALWRILYTNRLHAAQAVILPSGTAANIVGQSATTFIVGGPADTNVPLAALDADAFGIYGSSSTLALNVNTGATVALRNGTSINEFSTDVTLGGNSDLAVPTERAAQGYIATRLNFQVTMTSNLALVPQWPNSIPLTTFPTNEPITITSVEFSATAGQVYTADGMFTVKWTNSALRTLRTSLYFQMMMGATSLTSGYSWYDWDLPVVATATVYRTAKSSYKFTAPTTATLRINLVRTYVNDTGSTQAFALKVGRIS